MRLAARDGCITVRATGEDATAVASVVEGLLARLRAGHPVTSADIRYAVRQAYRPAARPPGALGTQIVTTRKGVGIAPKTAGQAAYVTAVGTHDLTFCIGPAGTGKTYLAMALAVGALGDKTVSRIVLTRPIVEAGEALGFLPGDIMDKVDPYLRPLHDALHDILGGDRFQRLLSRGTIEVIPLAYMRGRTLNDSFIVLDEAQNATRMQAKMALTRIGFGSKMVVTGDVTQTDLPTDGTSGLLHAVGLLRGVEGIAFCELTRDDIVRHDLVQRIVAAYGDDTLGTEQREKSD